MAKKSRPSANRQIDKYALISAYRRFKRNPLKVFVLKDFPTVTQRYREKYLGTLKILGVIEEVPAIYKCGHKLVTRRTVKGYKLLK